MRAYTQGVVRAILLAALLLPAVLAQDRQPPAKASGYPAHGAVQGLEIGADYLVHSIPTEQSYLFAKDYLVVEVALFPSKGESIRISSEQFKLRINQGKPVLFPDSSGTVAASLKYPDWEQHPTVTAQAGPVIVGSPTSPGRFPGDPTRGVPLPRPAGDPPDPSGVDKEPPKTVDEALARAALPEGLIEKPVRGCLYFRFRGKTKSIQSIELVYDSGDGKPKAAIPLL